ncbi:efflux RND transporter periplasmic adaptor subunit [Ramlibacter albus]|uniref:Efflux RND transporter periplasmic adaptor subunit n=1 Tax=Ramlibacter albus TaxID=2079448 RepID=A0A923S3L2_9BURK|nr:efflux RND transporter periplasmic adaptor subunit [Ramlibacter albus]
MKANTLLAAAVAATIAAGAGYWFGQRGHTPQTASAAPEPTKQRKVLYYRNPMGLPDTSPVPKKDPMGMDYVPVYEGEDSAAASASGQVRISTEKVQKLGVRTELASMRTLGQAVRAVGRVEPDERHVHVISPKFEGYVERLHVNVTGQPVARGQPLFEVYSPELVAAQREYAIAMQGTQAMAGAGAEAQAGMKQLAESALARLRNWDLPPEHLAALVKNGEPRRTVTFRSPVGGIVTEKKAVQGMRFMPGEMLYQVTDLSAVWVVAEVNEQDLGSVRSGAAAAVRINAYPDKALQGRVTYVYPTLKAETRTVPVRIELPNPGGLLKPGMFAQVELQAGARTQVLAVPDSAVIDSGTRRIVLVDKGEGRFEPREVKTGARGDNFVQVLEGVKEGERVVVAANFLIDAESNLKAAVSGLGPAASPAPAAPTAVGHKASGTVEAVDAKAGTVTLNHGPVPTLKWPAMTMEFKVANSGLLAHLQPKAKVNVEFVERGAGEWVITSVQH